MYRKIGLQGLLALALAVSSSRAMAADCDPQCAADQYCETTGVQPLCLELCNAPNGCKATETCVHDTATTGHCAPPTCGGVECEEGQVCHNFGTEETPDEKCSCIPADTFEVGGVLQPDSCPAGYICSMGPVESQEDIVPSVCRKPGEWEDCVKTVGCADGEDGAILECTSDIYPGSTLCLQRCGQNADASGATPHTEKCADPALACRAVGSKAFCTYNFCIDMCQGAGCFTDAQRAKLFQPCTGAGLNDSTCQPGAIEDSGTVYEYGLCVQAGHATSRGKCNPDATRLSDPTFATMCPINEACMGVHPTTTNDSWTGQVGECLQMCNAYPGANPAPSPVANCTGSANYCMDVTGVPSIQKTILGFCLNKCDLFGTDTCPDNNVGDKQGCWPDDRTLTDPGYCHALVSNPGKLGESCSSNENDPRSVCGDRLVCRQPSGASTGVCSGWCDTNTCSDPTQGCSSCLPPTAACKPVLDGASDLLGICEVPFGYVAPGLDAGIPESSPDAAAVVVRVDAGGVPGDDAGTSEATPSPSSGGCSCSTSASDLPMGFATLLIAAGLLLGRVARRRT
ncbi:MAG: hypothetical protein HY901_38120 [Deltaproteobacteria bacterium]|nr:hypothetical protein [Deltaproteobacteria bacterium]